MNTFEWLAQPCTPKQDNLQHLAELIAVNNGSMVVVNVGNTVADAEFKYRRRGLTLKEGFELCYMRGILEGTIIGCGAPQSDVHELIRNEMEKTGLVAVPIGLEVARFGRQVVDAPRF